MMGPKALMTATSKATGWGKCRRVPSGNRFKSNPGQHMKTAASGWHPSVHTQKWADHPTDSVLPRQAVVLRGRNNHG